MDVASYDRRPDSGLRPLYFIKTYKIKIYTDILK